MVFFFKIVICDETKNMVQLNLAKEKKTKSRVIEQRSKIFECAWAKVQFNIMCRKLSSWSEPFQKSCDKPNKSSQRYFVSYAIPKPSYFPKLVSTTCLKPAQSVVSSHMHIVSVPFVRQPNTCSLSPWKSIVHKLLHTSSRISYGLVYILSLSLK